MTQVERSLSNLTVRDFVRVPFKFYSIVGIKLFKWDENDLMTNKEKLMLAFHIVNMTFNFFCKCSFAIFEEFEDTVQLTQWCLYLTFSINGLFKMFSVAFGRVTLLNVLKNLELIFPRSTKERREFREAEGYIYLMRHCKIMAISHWSIVLMFIVFPVVQSSVEYFQSDDEHLIFIARTPYIMTYPFDVSAGVGYLFAYITQFMAGCGLSCLFVGSDMLLLCTIYMVNMQFRYLSNRIRCFQSVDFERDMKELKYILEKHYILNDLAERVNNVFSLSILLNYMISIIVIVFIGVQIAIGSFGLDFIKFVGFFTSATTQVYYVCMFGSQLTEYSAEVGEAFIGQEWYMADVRYQRMLTLAIARSQNPAHLTAFKFFVISMESFSNLMTTAYQFFTLLKTRMDDQQR